MGAGTKLCGITPRGAHRTISTARSHNAHHGDFQGRWLRGPGGYPASSQVFRLLEQPNPQLLDTLDGVVAVCSLQGDKAAMSVLWPGVAESGECTELVSPLDLAPTLAAIAGLDVRPNAPLSFDGLNLVPVLCYGTSGHAALFFDNGVRMQDAVLVDDSATPPSALPRLREEWETWKRFMALDPLQ